ncbi:MAG TPA: hypothetical protein VH643_26880 [Gemmataceae bacterium]
MTWDVEHAYGWSSQQESDSNRLKCIECFRLIVSPTEADIWFTVVVQRVTPETEVRGRIMGPRCLFADTAEVVSPLRSVRHNEDERMTLIARTAIPNPGFWDPDNPLLYRVVLELWQDRRRCEVSGFDLGFRTIEMGFSHVFVNKQPFLLQGMTYLPQAREEAAARRMGGYNLVLAGKGQWNCWVRASPMGFLLLEKVTLSTLTPHYIGLLCQQPCFLGFVLDKELLDRSPWEVESFLRPWQERRVFIGLELDEPPPPSLPNGLSFLVCPESLLPVLSTTSLPKLVMRESKAGTD